MLPNRISLSNYRSFAGPQELELRPITLLYGHNNAGKSALVRSLALLSDSAKHDGLDSLKLGGRLEDLELDFDALRWKGRAETDERSIGLGLHWDHDPTLSEARYSIWEHPDWRRLLIEQLALSGGNEHLALSWSPDRAEEHSPALSYRFGRDDASITSPLRFEGLTPTAGPSPESPLLASLRERTSALSGSTLWLRSLRPPPKRVTEWRESARWELKPNGMDAPVLLASFPELLKEVSSWYRGHLGYDLLADEFRKREVRVLLRNRSQAAFDLDLIDAGEGLGQVLPVLTALAMVRRHADRDGNPRILALEEPEAHLHPDLQVALAERIVDVVASSKVKPRVVVETHSQYLVLALQRAILKEQLSEQDVVLYWVRQGEDGQSVADRVEFTKLALFDGPWPWDAFEEKLELAAEIQDLRDEAERR